MDNLNTHRPGALYEAYPSKQAKALWDRFECVHTPKHGSWLNVTEVEINVMVRQCLNRRIESMDIMSQEVGPRGRRKETAWKPKLTGSSRPMMRASN